MESWFQSKSVLSLVLIMFLITTGNSDSSTSGDNQKNEAPRRNSTTKSLIETSEKPFRCYTCSWSEMANSSVPNIDVCSSFRFVPEAAATVACDYGCQTVAYRTTKTGDARHFHRNCLKKSEDREPRDRCVINFSKSYGFEEICECMTNLCNGAPSNRIVYNYQVCGILLLSIICQLVSLWQ